MIASEHAAPGHETSLPALIADRLLLLAIISIFAQLSLSGSNNTVASTAWLLALQASLAVAYNGRKLWKFNRKVSRRQLISAGIMASALIVQLMAIVSSISSLGVFQTTIFYFSFEILLELSPIHSLLQKVFWLSRLSPKNRKKIDQHSRKKAAIAVILLSFLTTCLFSEPSSFGSVIKQGAVNDADFSKQGLSAAAVIINLRALLHICAASGIGYFGRGFMSSGIRATGFSSLRRAYGIYVCLAAVLAVPVLLIYQLCNWSESTYREFSAVCLLLYPVAASLWFLFNSPSRDREPASHSFVAFIFLLACSFFFEVAFHQKSLSVLCQLIVAFLSGIAILALTSSSRINYRFDFLYGPNELRSIFRHVMERQTTRKIFIFLCINFAFTFIEVFYGYWTNSIGLISDAVHMLFDCTALAIGLYASYIARMKANDEFPYGYGRFEVVSGYVNGIFLVFISFSVFVESFERLFDPPDIKGSEILVVAILGLVVNIIGLIFFRDAHSHSHGADGCHNHNSNMQGIFLHVLADALGSVGVIISSLLVQFFNLTIADPICSLIIAVLILSSVVNLLKETSLMLLLRSPPDLDRSFPKVLNKVLSMKGVVGVRDLNLWSFRSDERISSICVHVDSNTVGQTILSDIKTVLRKLGLKHISIQIETDDFVSRLEPEIRTRYRRVDSTLQGSLDLDGSELLDTPLHDHKCHGHGHSHH